MQRRSLDRMISWVALTLTALLIVVAGLMLILSALGLWHARRTPAERSVFAAEGEREPAGAV
jgi:hypothetical protein